MMEILRAMFYFVASVAAACYVATFIRHLVDEWHERRGR